METPIRLSLSIENARFAESEIIPASEGSRADFAEDSGEDGRRAWLDLVLMKKNSQGSARIDLVVEAGAMRHKEAI